MRKVVYGAACSLDGFIAGRDGAIDWLHFSKDVEAVLAETWPRFDAVLMGRKTWMAGREMGAGDTGSPVPGAAVYVFSRTLESIDVPGITLVRDDATAFVRRLKAAEGGDICLMGGGILAQDLLAAGLVDEVGVNIHPLLLGAGVPLFRETPERIPLRLTEQRLIDGGCILATYEVLPVELTLRPS